MGLRRATPEEMRKIRRDIEQHRWMVPKEVQDRYDGAEVAIPSAPEPAPARAAIDPAWAGEGATWWHVEHREELREVVPGLYLRFRRTFPHKESS